MVADRLGLTDRGRLAPGMAADVVVFDPATVGDPADFVDPHQYATGVPYVLVNGQVAVDNGVETGVLAGRVLEPAR
jgi:N-acyl-D-amino-acid deacylase